jgi:hypothetical protein
MIPRRLMKVARQFFRVVVLVLGLTLLASAPARGEDSTNQVRSATERAGLERRKLPFAKGTLTGIDFLRHELRLKTADGAQTFLYTPRTYIFRDKDKITVDKLKIGEIVAVRFTTNNDDISTLVRIKVYASPTADAMLAPSSMPTNQPRNALP